MHSPVKPTSKLLVRYIFGLVIFFTIAMLSYFQPVLAQNTSDQEKISDVTTLFRQANTDYQQGRYGQALQSYRRLVNAGYSSGNLYYNLGNTYYQLGEKGWAVLFFEKAKRLIPQDADLKTNLKLAVPNEGSGIWFNKAYNWLITIAPLDQLTKASSVTFFLFMTLLCLTFPLLDRIKNGHTGRIKIWWLGLLVITGILFVFFSSVTAISYGDRCQNNAVIVKPGVKAYFEPSQSESAYFQVGEGSRISILEIKDNWAFFKQRDGKRGWILREYYERI